MTGNWESLDLDGKAIKETKRQNDAKAREIAGRFYECFSTEAGEFVLERLKEITLNRSVLNANSTQFGAGIREGQNMLVRQILDQIVLATGEKNRSSR